MQHTDTRSRAMIDGHWFEQISQIYKDIGETYVALEPLPATVQRQRLLFERSDYQMLPDLHPDRVEPVKVTAAIARLEQLRVSITGEEANRYVRQAYVDTIDDLLTNARLIMAAHNKDIAAVNAENNRLYGRPDESIFKAVCTWIRNDVTRTPTLDNEWLDILAQDVLDSVPGGVGDPALLMPDDITFHKVRQLHHLPGGYYDHLFGASGLPTGPYISQIEGDQICREVLRNIGSDYQLAASENNIWATLRDKKQVIRPLGYRLDRDEFIGIVSHEIGSHILEVTNGSAQPLRLLSMGLAGYEKSNEGRAFLREQIVYPHESVFLHQFSWEYIILLYLSVCLAQGLADKKYTFPELYAVVYALYAFWRERRSPNATNNEAFAREEAWHLTVRIYKGSAGTDGSYMKDIVYLDGNIRCWQLAKANPAFVMMGDKGKFDSTNQTQITLLQGLGILP